MTKFWEENQNQILPLSLRVFAQNKNAPIRGQESAGLKILKPTAELT